MTEYVIETYNLGKKYNNKEVVKDINLKIESGTIYGLLGKNGAGKTTLMCMLLNLVKANNGKVYIFGHDNQDEGDKVYSKVGSIIETPGFYTNLTGKENLELFSKIQQNNSEIDKVLKIVSLYDDKDKLFKNYSLGMKQRLGIALTLIKEPEVLILDEPINGLDPLGIKEMRNLLKKLSHEFNMTILISSHILSEIEQLVDVIGVLNNGEIIQEMSIDELQKNLNQYVNFKLSNTQQASNILAEYGLKNEIDFEITDDANINLTTNLDLRSKLVKTFIFSDIEVYEMRLITQTLEEYFINLLNETEAELI